MLARPSSWYATCFAPMLLVLCCGNAPADNGKKPPGPDPASSLQICVDGQRLQIESTHFTARFEGPALVSVVARGTGAEFCRADANVFPLELVYLGGDTLKQDKHQETSLRQLSPLAARIVVTGNDSDREMLVALDPATGDLCITPSGHSARAGVLAVRWNVPLVREAALVLPCVNGLYVEADRPFPRGDRFPWPFRWNAQLAIAERGETSLMIHSDDTACKFKALKLSRDAALSTLGFDSEQVGPVWNNRAAGGVQWRLNVYPGDWKKPASRYRDWLRRVYQLEEKRACRPAWVKDIDFTLQWAKADPALLDAMAKIHPPARTLIHLSDWRTSKYDVDYPDYVPSAEARKFVEKANAMGFKVMLHFNFFACYNKHPLFQQVRDWQIRSVGRNEPEGWYWPPQTHDYTRMAYIHPGLGLWRRHLIDAVRQACTGLRAPMAFLDQTLCTWNTDNGIVENLTTVEGMRQLQEEFSAIGPEPLLAGEGLNEISFQRQCFAQAHIHDGWGDLRPEHIPAAHPICSFLWEGHTRLVGYHHLGPNGKDAEIGVEVYRRMGAIPTLICNEPALITKDQPLVKKLLMAADEQNR